ncbi:uncharacterized protein BDW70DRAFT_129231 [Aspergillus foveolatus]|uniref:uncharacterized protein n=1 Tax=Aspergillus foveolatus TaxID=210207 RepID=UPI003CCCD68B
MICRHAIFHSIVLFCRFVLAAMSIGGLIVFTNGADKCFPVLQNSSFTLNLRNAHM